MHKNHLQTIAELERLDFTDKGEAFVESKFLTPLLGCLGYETHRDYEVIRHGDDGSSFKLKYPPVKRGAKSAKTYNPDFIPTIRKKAFWIIEAKSPKAVSYPFEENYLVQGFQYCIHPEIQAKYLVVSNGCDSAVYDAYGTAFLNRELYQPIAEFKSAELSKRWPELYELLSVETLRGRIETGLREMYDKLCLSSLDEDYPRVLLQRIGVTQFANSQEIRKRVRQLSIEKVRREQEAISEFKRGLTAEQAYAAMDKPLTMYGAEGVVFVEKSISDEKPVEEIFDQLIRDFDRQTIFRQLQSYAGVCTLYRKTQDDAAKSRFARFLFEHQDHELPLLTKVECAWIRTVRKQLMVAAYPTIEQSVMKRLQSTPELERFVIPPTGLHEAMAFELIVHDKVFSRLLALSEPELEKELVEFGQAESLLDEQLKQVPRNSQLYSEAQFTWFADFGISGKHFGFKNIFHQFGIETPSKEAT